MSPDIALGQLSQMLWTGVLVAAPVLIAAITVGLFVSILQVITQIQEMTLTFVPKVLAIIFSISIFGPWMLRKLVAYASYMLGQAPAQIF